MESLTFVVGKKPETLVLIGRFHLRARMRGAKFGNGSIEKVDLIVKVDDCTRKIRSCRVGRRARPRIVTYHLLLATR